jgi:hypothetical protein
MQLLMKVKSIIGRSNCGQRCGHGQGRGCGQGQSRVRKGQHPSDEVDGITKLTDSNFLTTRNGTGKRLSNKDIAFARTVGHSDSFVSRLQLIANFTANRANLPHADAVPSPCR